MQRLSDSAGACAMQRCAVLVMLVVSVSGLKASGQDPGESVPDAPQPQMPLNQQPAQRPAQAAADAQTHGEPPAPHPCSQRGEGRQVMSAEQLKQEESQYIVSVVPNFNTVFAECAPPLSAGQKWNLVYHTAIAPFTAGMAALLGAADEVTGSHNGYGWGPAGYFKRFGAEFADTLSSGAIGNGLLPVLLHQDPRYFEMGPGHPFWKRVAHAAKSDFVCFSDSGKTQFNTSNVVGNLLSGTLSNAYYPANERGVGLTLENALKVTLEGSFGSQMLEFSPDMTAWLYRRFHHESGAPPSPAAVYATAP